MPCRYWSLWVNSETPSPQRRPVVVSIFSWQFQWSGTIKGLLKGVHHFLTDWSRHWCLTIALFLAWLTCNAMNFVDSGRYTTAHYQTWRVHFFQNLEDCWGQWSSTFLYQIKYPHHSTMCDCNFNWIWIFTTSRFLKPNFAGRAISPCTSNLGDVNQRSPNRSHILSPELLKISSAQFKTTQLTKSNCSTRPCRDCLWNC